MAQATIVGSGSAGNSIVGSGWDFEVERGPDWLFVRPRKLPGFDPGACSAAGFAEQIWTLLEQQFATRVVLELGELAELDGELAAELIELRTQIQRRHGLMRVCELTDAHEDFLRTNNLCGHFPRFETREDAVMGHALPRQPR